MLYVTGILLQSSKRRREEREMRTCPKIADTPPPKKRSVHYSLVPVGGHLGLLDKLYDGEHQVHELLPRQQDESLRRQVDGEAPLMLLLERGQVHGEVDEDEDEHDAAVGEVVPGDHPEVLLPLRGREQVRTLVPAAGLGPVHLMGGIGGRKKKNKENKQTKKN